MTKKIVNVFKKNPGITFWSVLLLSLWIYHKDLFFIIILLYTYIIILLLSNIFKEKTKKYISISVWIFAGLVFLTVLYVNNYMPHGEIIDLTEYGCEPSQNREEREDCYQEDMRNLQIPEWAKFLRSYGILLIMGLAGMGICAGSKKSEE
ncbi:MAG: hypothetical protein EOM84_00480 [Sphingobacteriia bacterium]|jgi:predicted membrane metal-binding protein|nr:hypothetical protein [Sphingobacteriia bacterium]